jgi:hypothetical protein
MKKFWIFWMTVATITSASSFGNLHEKLYIELDRVIFDTAGIYVEVGNCYQKVDEIMFDKDESRYYVLKKETKWKCGNCGKYNDPKNNNCWYCGWPWGPP